MAGTRGFYSNELYPAAFAVPEQYTPRSNSAPCFFTRAEWEQLGFLQWGTGTVKPVQCSI